MSLARFLVLAVAIPLAWPSQSAPNSEAHARTNLVLNGAIEFVYLAAGTFRMGCPPNPPPPWSSEDSAQPEHIVNISGYYISKYPVTVKQFAGFLNTVGFKEDYVDRRVISKSLIIDKEGAVTIRGQMQSKAITGVTREGSAAFCTWVGRNSGQRCRLPTEAEWEYAARGTSGRIYPWGNEIKKATLWNDDVGRHPELSTGDGVCDLYGPVLQWCLDGYDVRFYAKSSVDNPWNAIGDGRFALRGGPMGRYGRNDEVVFPPAWKRFALRDVERTIYHVGFRVVIVPNEFDQQQGSEPGFEANDLTSRQTTNELTR